MGWRDWFRLGRAAPRDPIPEALWRSTVQRLPFVRSLGAAEMSRLRALCAQFLADKEFSSAGGLGVDDAMCLEIAVQGCLPVLNLGLSAYGDWVGIVVYPDEFVVPRRIEDEDGVVHEFEDVLAGESWAGGPLLVSWRDVRMAGEGYNVVIHEFAHKLDMRNGEADGMPALHGSLTAALWSETMSDAYVDFCQRVDAGEALPFDPYAAEHPAEFFAVLSEVFFVSPESLSDSYPAVYDLFVRYYRQDPLRRFQAFAEVDREAR